MSPGSRIRSPAPSEKASRGLGRMSMMKIGGLRRLVFFALLMGLWEILYRLGVWNSTLFPSPVQVAQSLGRSIADRSLLTATADSLRRILAGYALSLLLGVPLG